MCERKKARSRQSTKNRSLIGSQPFAPINSQPFAPINNQPFALINNQPFALINNQPFTLSLSKRRARLRQAQPERAARRKSPCILSLSKGARTVVVNSSTASPAYLLLARKPASDISVRCVVSAVVSQSANGLPVMKVGLKAPFSMYSFHSGVAATLVKRSV